MNNFLRGRASANFERYLNEFLRTGKSVGLPAQRLSESEWKQLNTELSVQGLQLIPESQNGMVYYWFSKISTRDNLRDRASTNFEKYLNEFLNTGETTGLPAQRLSQDEWKRLNSSLIEEGVQLVPYERAGIVYYWFARAGSPVDKISVFANGKEALENKLIKILQKKYPNLSTIAILNMLRSDNPTDDNMIYRMLRYKQDGQYTDVSQQEFEDAFYYAMTSAYNGIEIVNRDKMHNWDGADEFVTKHAIPYFPNEKWPTNRYIVMNGKQDWTWFRSCKGNIELPVRDPHNPNGFHISLNVRVTKDLLKVLDNILIKDAGKYIHSYKFPKTNFYDEILSRHDPVTIYIYTRNPELEKQIVNAVQPFVRSNDGLIGEMVGNGVSIAPETSNQNVHISVGRQIAMDIAQIIKQNIGTKS